MTARYGTEDAAPRSAETVEHACGPLLERAQEALAFERERADKAEVKAAGYENAITWGTSCMSCAAVLNSCYEETVRRERAEAALARVRELAGSWAAMAPAGRSMVQDFTTPPHDTVSADCGRAVLALLGDTAGVPS